MFVQHVYPNEWLCLHARIRLLFLTRITLLLM